MRPKKQRRPIKSFEIDAKNEALLQLAMDSTGASQTELFNALVDRYLGSLVKDMNKERSDSLKKFENHWKHSNSH
jgi:hypothetical protein